jgi:DNA-binding PadR family transcriptional regulator
MSNWANFDFSAMANSLRENIKTFGGFSPETVRRSGLLNEEGLRLHILASLQEGSKTGHEIVEALAALNFKPTAGAVYPLLESLLDEGLISVAVKKDRKVYSITNAGKKLASSSPAPEEILEEGQETSWAPKWVDVRGVVPVAAGRLAKVSLEVSQYGTKEQQEQAAEAIDEARRRIHEILSEK